MAAQVARRVQPPRSGRLTVARGTRQRPRLDVSLNTVTIRTGLSLPPSLADGTTAHHYGHSYPDD